MNGNTYVYITKAIKQSTYLNMLDNIKYMLLIPTTPVYIRELVQNKSVKKVCISHDLIGFSSKSINHLKFISNELHQSISPIAWYVKQYT